MCIRDRLKTFLAIQFLHVVAELLTSPKDAVKLIVAETNAPVVGDGVGLSLIHISIFMRRL